MRDYLTLVTVLKGFVDFLLLLGADRLTQGRASRKRLAAAAALGAGYAMLCLQADFRFLGNVWWRLVFLGLMGMVGFGLDRAAIRCGALFTLLSLSLEGLARSLLEGDLNALPLAAVALWAVYRTAMPGENRQLIPLRIRWRGKSVELTALKDTGNTLRDPVTGKQVVVISANAARQLTGLQPWQLKDPVQTLAQEPVPGLRLIPYRAVGCSGGLLLGMVFEDVVLGSQRGRSVIAFDPGGLSEQMGYQALTGGAL